MIKNVFNIIRNAFSFVFKAGHKLGKRKGEKHHG